MVECCHCKKQTLTFQGAIGDNGVWEIYCQTCYSKVFLDNYDAMQVSQSTEVTSVCECGKEKHGFASHSRWCEKYGV